MNKWSKKYTVDVQLVRSLWTIPTEQFWVIHSPQRESKYCTGHAQLSNLIGAIDHANDHIDIPVYDIALCSKRYNVTATG